MRLSDYKLSIEPKYKDLTMEGRKYKILEGLEYFKDNKRYEKYNGYAPLYELENWICQVMGWVIEKRLPIRRGYRTYIMFDCSNIKCKETIRRMEEQGYIEISNSGKGFKVLKTK